MSRPPSSAAPSMGEAQTTRLPAPPLELRRGAGAAIRVLDEAQPVKVPV